MTACIRVRAPNEGAGTQNTGVSASPTLNGPYGNPDFSGTAVVRSKNRIECWDYSSCDAAAKQRQRVQEGLLQQASVELGEHLSMHPALRTDHVTDGEFRPLSLTGEVRINGCGRLSKQHQPVTLVPVN
jgi:hypothetical protein